MPFGDGTGPLGQGPRTGRGAGLCSGSAVPGAMNRNGGFGRGRGGRGWRNQFRATGFTGWERGRGGRRVFAPCDAANVPGAGFEPELTALKNQAASLQTTLSQIHKRLEELEVGPK